MALSYIGNSLLGHVPINGRHSSMSSPTVFCFYKDVLDEGRDLINDGDLSPHGAFSEHSAKPKDTPTCWMNDGLFLGSASWRAVAFAEISFLGIFFCFSRTKERSEGLKPPWISDCSSMLAFLLLAGTVPVGEGIIALIPLVRFFATLPRHGSWSENLSREACNVPCRCGEFLPLCKDHLFIWRKIQLLAS